MLAKSQLTLMAGLATLCLQPLAANEAGELPSTPANPKTLQQVVVTGTHSASMTEASSISPLDVITPKDLHTTGTTELATALARILPSLNFPRPAINSGSTASRPAQLRGLSPDDVLVLVDGKRWHTSSVIAYQYTVGRGSSPADLNSIPMSAVDHVEVLRDGAAAQYGSDAIAGVVNVILKKGKSGGNFETNYGVTTEGDGAQNGFSGDQGFALGQKGSLHLAYNYQHGDPTNRGGADLRNSNSPTYGTNDTPDGDPKTNTYQFMANADLPITEDIDFYGYTDISNRNVTSNGYYRTKYGDSPSDPSSLTTLNSDNIDALHPHGYLPWLTNILKDRALVLGVKGTTAGGWNWDVSANYGQNKTTFSVDNSMNVALYDTTGSTPSHFYAGTLGNTEKVLNLDVSKDLDVGLASPVTFAYGAEYRHEAYSIDAGEPDSYYTNPLSDAPGQSEFFAGYQPSDAGTHTRHNYAAYVSAESDITSNFSGSIAARYEKYSDFGSTRSGKISGRYQFTDSFALRGTISNGFRAPSLGQEYFSATTDLPLDGRLVTIGTLPVNSVGAQALGASSLKAEKSTNYSLGAVWSPTANFNATIDAYQINIRNQIVLSDQISSDAVAAYLERVLPGEGVIGGQYFTNGVNTRNRGANAVLNYEWTASNNDQYGAHLAYSYSRTKVTHIEGTPSILTANGLDDVSVIGRASLGVIEKYNPRTKLNLSLDYAHGPFSANVLINRYGSYTIWGSTTAGDQTFSSRWLLGFSTSLDINKHLRITIGGDNIFNAYPNRLKAGSLLYYYGIAPYPTISPYGFNGAYYYAKLNIHWD